MSDQVPVLKDEEGRTVAVLNNRFRLKGGTVTHRAAVQNGDDYDGLYAVVLCDDSRVQWIAEDEEERLGLVQPDDADVTCKECRRVTRSLLPETEGEA